MAFMCFLTPMTTTFVRAKRINLSPESLLVQKLPLHSTYLLPLHVVGMRHVQGYS
jgi:hypothetical protein